MFGLEKEKPGKWKKFEFDLEVELKKNPEKAKNLLNKAQSHIQEIKSILREGKKTKEFDNLGVLLHAYTATEKVVKKIQKI